MAWLPRRESHADLELGFEVLGCEDAQEMLAFTLVSKREMMWFL